MKEKEFLKIHKNLKLVLDIYYSIDDEGNVQVDFDSMNEDWESLMEELEEETK